MGTDSNIDIVRAVFAAYGSGNRAQIEPLIAADFHFTSPLDNRIDRTVYFERCWPNSGRLDGFDFIYLVPDGDRVFVTYEARAVGGRRLRNTEVHTLRDGQLVEVEVYFGWSIPHKAKAGGFVDQE